MSRYARRLGTSLGGLTRARHSPAASLSPAGPTANLAVTTSREDFRALAAEHRVVPVTPQGARRQRDAAVGVPQARRQPSRHVPAGIRRERPVLVALVVHRRGRAVGADGARRRGGLAGRRRRRDAPSGGDPLQALRATLRAAGDRSRCPACRRCPAGWSASSPTTWCGGWSGCPNWPSTTCGCPTCCCCWPPTSPRVDHHEGTITLIANAVNWNGTDERVDWAYDDAVAAARRDDRGAGRPLPSTVATFSRPEPLHRAQRTVEEYARDRREAGRRDRGGRGLPGGAVAAVRDGHRRRPARRLPDAAGDATPARTCTCSTCPMTLADWTSRSSGPARRRW